MKAITLVLSISLFSACSNSSAPVQSNTNVTTSNDRPSTMIAHGPSSADPAASTANSNTSKAKWTQSGDPIDTAKLDAAVNLAVKALAVKPTDAAAKKAVSEAYFDRGTALTEARQYASALGDYRKAYKADPSNTVAKEWIDKIILIYDGLKKDYPKEGEEPPPLPFKK